MKSYSHRRKLNKIRKELEEKENPWKITDHSVATKYNIMKISDILVGVVTDAENFKN